MDRVGGPKTPLFQESKVQGLMGFQGARVQGPKGTGYESTLLWEPPDCPTHREDKGSRRTKVA